jgi:hypothetical protein
VQHHLLVLLLLLLPATVRQALVQCSQLLLAAQGVRDKRYHHHGACTFSSSRSNKLQVVQLPSAGQLQQQQPLCLAQARV